MPRSALAATLLAAAILAGPSVGRADVPSQCRELFVESRFDLARECIDDALDAQQGEPAAVVELFAYRAAILTALRLDEEARECVEVVLALEPAWEAEDPLLTSPRIQSLVESVRQTFDVTAGRPSLEHEAPETEEVEGDSLVVEARAPNVEAPLEAVLMVRREGEARYQALPLRGRPGRVLTARLPLEPGEGVDYYLAIRVPGGWEALRSGSPSSPFHAVRGGGHEGPGPGPGAGPAPGPGPGPGPGGEQGIGERYWWVWTIAGVAAVGLAVGLGVGLGLSGDQDAGSVRIHFP